MNNQDLARIILHANILAYSVAEEIQEDHPERARQLFAICDPLGEVFNLLNADDPITIEVFVGDEEEE